MCSYMLRWLILKLRMVKIPNMIDIDSKHDLDAKNKVNAEDNVDAEDDDDDDDDESEDDEEEISGSGSSALLTNKKSVPQVALRSERLGENAERLGNNVHPNLKNSSLSAGKCFLLV